MHLLIFLGVLANPDDHKKVAQLEKDRQNYKRVAELLSKRIGADEVLMFSDFIDEAALSLNLNQGFVGEVMWDIMMEQYAFSLDADFHIKPLREIKTPEFGKIDASALALV